MAIALRRGERVRDQLTWIRDCRPSVGSCHQPNRAIDVEAKSRGAAEHRQHKSLMFPWHPTAHIERKRARE
jgi:hypothetical protein